ncbi:MAG: hypothetical protein C0410_03170 [Anaerolinea sp.]|nr:hypothetical protein [Anaerolinea sp.]
MIKKYFSIIICLTFLMACTKVDRSSIDSRVTATFSPISQTNTPTEFVSASATTESTPDLVSNWEWPRTTPEEQGVSSAMLADMLEKINGEGQQIHSVLVIRHGVLVMEAYLHPFNAQTRHDIYSVTKSVTSALIGIAIADGSLGDVQTKLISYFPSIVPADPAKNEISLENILSMTSGIEWMEPLHSGLNDHWWIIDAEDPAQYFFTPALIEEPGKVFNYNSGGSHMLSLIIQQSTGEKAAAFAEKRLFSPLSISDYSWESDLSGHSLGSTGLELLPFDMAKIGQLYLNGGKWQGEQLLSSDWVSNSIQVHSHPSESMGYGYQWWIRPQGDYYALGWGGQQIRVFPKQDMVVVITAGSSGSEILHDDLVDNFILPAVISNESIPADIQSQERLSLAIDSLAQPKISTSASLSKMAADVDGKEWLITGMGEWSMFTLHFPNESEAQFDLTIDGEPMPLKVGLDGVYRITDTKEYGPIALLGYWESEDTFVLKQQILREADRRSTRIQFIGDSARIFSEWFVEPYQEETDAVLFRQPQ